MTIHIVDIEAVDTRYTKQWKDHLPRQLQRATNEDVKVISGGETSGLQRPGLPTLAEQTFTNQTIRKDRRNVL